MNRFLIFYLFFNVLTVLFAAKGCVNQQCAANVAESDAVFLIETSTSMGADNFAKVQNLLYNLVADLSIGSTLDKSRLAFITFSQDAKTYGGLDAGATASAVNATIGSLNFDNYGFREMSKALTAEEQIITSLRATAKKLLIAIVADTFTGVEPSANGLLDKVRSRYDALLSIAVGPQAIQYAYTDVTTFSGTPADSFFVSGVDQLDFAKLWIERNMCPTYHASTPYVTTTLPVTQPSGVTCQLNTLTYDIYLVVDTSKSMSSSDFAAMKQSVRDFVREYSVNDNKTQFGLIAVSVDPQRYYTGFHAGQNMNSMLNALNLLTQEPTSGQSFDMALQVIDAAFLSTYGNDGKVQLLVYFTGNTNFDKDPSGTVSKLKTKYGLKFAAVQYTSNADATKLTNISGGAACTIDATSSDKRATLGATLENLTCG
uniref:VWFA domain-containing protein n=1 Tax=Panagrolaimus sp. JU765 TaxID=591449 RepID=A0AC34Q5L1_9BILA